MTELQRIQADGLADLLEEHGIQATREQIEAISRDFAHNIDMERQISLTPHMRTGTTKCNNCENKDAEIKRLSTDIECYRKDVKRHLNCDRVWVNNSGDVVYE